ncbi:MAG: Gfo/Idh/MocA family oxidoreductase [Planctomycetota bacterium]|nr:Gfo/Idh/MocA family oxidoreductase [Planctomycetota bacterium]
MSSDQEVTRRQFNRTTIATGAAAVGLTLLGGRLRARAPKRTVKVGLIGCGGRGTGAIGQHVRAGQILKDDDPTVEVQVAGMADWYKEKAERLGQRHGVPKKRCFGGADAYKKLLDTDIDIVLMATPPVFRPLHFEASVNAGKHIFMEKPVAVDPVGCRRVLAAAKVARQKNLMVIAGTQRRHQRNYLEAQAAVAEGALGRILGGRVSWCGGHLGAREPFGEDVDAASLAANWVNWVEMSGDHIVEQHVHNIDVMNWFLGTHPISAWGFGGRARRPAGNQYDFFSVDFEFPEGVRIHSTCRQISGCASWVGEHLVAEKGVTKCAGGLKPSKPVWTAEIPQEGGGHQQEHINFLWLLARDRILNEADSVATSTATAIMGRTAAYTGQQVFWRDLMEDPSRKPDLYNLQLKPTAEDFETGEVVPPPEGVVRIPGVSAGEGRSRRRRRDR